MKLRYHLCVMPVRLPRFCLSLFAAFVLLLALNDCAQPPEVSARTPEHRVALLTSPPTEAVAVHSLSAQIVALSPTVHGDEANHVAACAYATARQLRMEYSVVGPALFHNFLINVGLRQRGLCYQWTQDLIARLDALKLSTLELHWGVARAGTLREHNCVVVTANGQPFQKGIVLDCWRHAGRLYWGSVTGDHYPWIEDRWDWRNALMLHTGGSPFAGAFPVASHSAGPADCR